MPLVEIRNVTKRFGPVTVLDDVSVAIGEGEIIAIIGRSGSGKSTLLRCINGLEPIQGGSIAVDGVRVTDTTTDLRTLRQQVGIVFQSYTSFPHMSAAPNFHLSPRSKERRGGNASVRSCRSRCLEYHKNRQNTKSTN